MLSNLFKISKIIKERSKCYKFIYLRKKNCPTFTILKKKAVKKSISISPTKFLQSMLAQKWISYFCTFYR